MYLHIFRRLRFEKGVCVMTIKKEILAAINSENATVRINGIAYLKRWKKDALGNDVDRMMITFAYVAGIKGGWQREIESRDYNGIIAEIEEATSEYMSMCAEQLTKNIRAGYR